MWFSGSSPFANYAYEYNGTQLISQKWGSNTVRFLYDESGCPSGFILNGAYYYYITNIQGDITAITDANGNVVAKYTYDEWGKILSITDGNGNDVSANASHIANINPLRYRGYYYDSETGLYYLLTRYYDPVTRRVINPDTTDVLTASMGALTDKNLFAYCDNNPIMRADVGGQFWATITGAIAGAIAGGISAAVSGDNILAGIGVGAATGALAGAAVDVAIATGGVGAVVIASLGGAVSSGINYAATEKINGREVDHAELAAEATVGAVANVLSFGMGGGSLTRQGSKVLTNMINNMKSELLKNTTKNVAGKPVYKTAKTVTKHIAKNLSSSIVEDVVVSGGSWLHSNLWRKLING